MKITTAILLLAVLSCSCGNKYPLPDHDDPTSGFRIGDKRFDWQERVAEYLDNGQLQNNDPSLLSFKRTWNTTFGDIPVNLHLNDGKFQDSPLFSITVTLPSDSTVVGPSGRDLSVTSSVTFGAVLRLLELRYGEPEVLGISDAERSYRWKNLGYTITVQPSFLWSELSVALPATIEYRSNQYKNQLQDAQRRKTIKDLKAVQP